MREFIKIVETLNSKVDDSWFETNSFKTFKKPVPVKFELATDNGTIDTLEGPVRYEAGHYIMTGPKGERYPITAEKFKSLYDKVGANMAQPKKIIKLAKLADHDGYVTLAYNGSKLNYTAGDDYIVRHGVNDYGVVKADIFRKTYDTSQDINL